MHSATDTSRSLPASDPSVNSSASVRVDEINVRPAVIGRFVIEHGQLLIDGAPVCPVCFENKGSEFCGCTQADLDAQDVGWNCQAVTA